MLHKLKVVSGFAAATIGTWGMMQYITPNDPSTTWYIVLIVAVAYFAGAVAAHELDRKPIYSK